MVKLTSQQENAYDGNGVSTLPEVGYCVNYLPHILENIPDELKAIHQWVAWIAVLNLKKGKPDKVPVNAHNGYAASVTNPKSWSDLDQAQAFYIERLGKAHSCTVRKNGELVTVTGPVCGVGFVLTPDSPLVGIDLDKCFDDQGELTPEARDIINTVRSYTEISPSGTGIRIFVKGKLPGAACRKGSIETYEQGRYLTVTGRVVSGLDIIAENQAGIDAFHAKYVAAPEKTKPAQPRKPQPVTQNDAELIRKAEQAANGDKFRRLMAGDKNEHSEDWSAADMALCKMLAFWTGNNAQQIDRIFRSSGLYRDKWDEQRGAQTYGELTTARAIAGTSEIYGDKLTRRAALGNEVAFMEDLHGVAFDDPGYLASFEMDAGHIDRAAETPAPVTQKKKTKAANDNEPSTTIFLRAGGRSRYLPEAYAVLRKTCAVFQRGPKNIVRVIRYNANRIKGRRKFAKVREGTLIIDRMEPVSLSLLIEEHAAVLKFDGRSGKDVPANFSEQDSLALIAESHTSGLPYLRGVINAPTLRPDGSILHEPGHDEATGLYVDNGGVRFPVERLQKPLTKRDAIRAIQILNIPIRKFPFVGIKNGKCASKSAMLASMITTVIRPALVKDDGSPACVPMFCAKASAAGSGKTKLAEIPAAIATGKRPSLLKYRPSSEDEFEKSAETMLMQGVPVILIDNINTELKSQFLEMFLTATEKECRVLGKSKSVVCPNVQTFFVTGNQIEIRGDLHRRTVYCEIDHEVERPEELRFSFEPVALTLRLRPHLVVACLTLVKAYLDENCPDQGVEYGSFEEWNVLVRSALIWAGEDDPLGERKAMEAADGSLQKIRALLSAWWDSNLQFGGAMAIRTGWNTTGRIIEVSKEHDGEGFADQRLHDALLDFCPDKTGAAVNSRQLGHYLKKYLRKPLTCNTSSHAEPVLLRLRAGEEHNQAVYFVERQVEGKWPLEDEKIQ